MGLQRHWQSRTWLAVCLLPLSALFWLTASVRRALYRVGLLRQQRFDVPIIVVGNITVGGTGKTPLVVYLARQLRAAGWRPGVVSRGYGGSNQGVCEVQHDSDADLVGDEALLIRQSGDLAVFVSPRRAEAVQALLDTTDCNVVLSDDGLQHYALARDYEIAVIDANRGFGNGWLLPAGPMRETRSRLSSVDLTVYHGQADAEASFALAIVNAVNLADGQTRPLSAFTGERVHAVAGIGDPERFFEALRDAGIDCQVHAFADHHRYVAAELDFGDARPVLMTAKDAVKCGAFADARLWMVPAELVDRDGRIAAAVAGFLARL